MDRYLILKAEIHNWSMKGPGSWDTATWYVFNTGSYRLETSEIPTENEIDKIMAAQESRGDPDRFRRRSVKKGVLSEEKLPELANTMERKPWRDPSIICDACDGEAWVITQFAEDGSIVQTSGEVDYIYGNRILETIVSLLPHSNDFCANAYIHGDKKD